MSTMLAAMLSMLMASDPTVQVVIDQSVPVRCGPTMDHYAWLTSDRGELVQVDETTPGWARIAAQGPVFSEAWGVMRHP